MTPTTWVGEPTCLICGYAPQERAVLLRFGDDMQLAVLCLDCLRRARGFADLLVEPPKPAIDLGEGL